MESVNFGYCCGNRKNGLFVFNLFKLSPTYGYKDTRLQNKSIQHFNLYPLKYETNRFFHGQFYPDLKWAKPYFCQN